MTKFIAALLILAMTGGLQPAAAGGNELAGTAWLVDDIGGRGVVDRARTTLQFLEPGRVAGHTGCNRFFGPVDQNEDRVSFGNLGVTRMACPESLMNQEQRFLEALSAASRFELTREGLVLLVFGAGSERVLRLSRITEK